MKVWETIDGILKRQRFILDNKALKGVKMKSQDKSIETLKLKGTLELLIERYGYERVQEVFMNLMR